MNNIFTFILILLFIVVVIGVVVFLALNSNIKKHKNIQVKRKDARQDFINRHANYRSPVIKKAPDSEFKYIYKHKKIRQFEIRGMHFRGLDSRFKGKFTGFAVCEDNDHDPFAVAIYNDEHDHIGYVPKGNKNLSTSISEWHDGQVRAWGELFYNGNWSGVVYIPVGLNSNEFEKFFIEFQSTE